jgi:small GTP-binding protein
MSLFNYATKEITLKIVYYGPGLSGKTTNIKYLHDTMSPDKKGQLLSLATEADRTLFFDFMPITLGKIKDFNVRFQLYTVPGQVRYNATRKLVLKGADAVVFVADSQEEMREQNIESLVNMRENLVANNLDPDDIPVVLQYNKRDLKNILSVEELDRDLNMAGYQITEGIAIEGAGVEKTFRLITKLLLKHISKKHDIRIDRTVEILEAGLLPKEKLIHEDAGEKKEVSIVSSFETSDEFTKEKTMPSEEEMERSILETTFTEEPMEPSPPSEEQAQTSSEEEWKKLLEVHGKNNSSTDAADIYKSLGIDEPKALPGDETQEEAEPPSTDEPDIYKSLGIDEPEALPGGETQEEAEPPSPGEPDIYKSLGIDEPGKESPPLTDEPLTNENVTDETFSFSGPSGAEKALDEEPGDISQESAEISILTLRLEEIIKELAENTTRSIIDALSEFSLELKGISAISDLTAELNSTNDLISQILEEFKETRKQQSEVLLYLKKSENTLKAIAGAALEAKMKKGNFKIFGK